MRRAWAEEVGPSFSSIGPDAERYGAAAEYPVPDAVRARWQGNPWQPADRVGAFTHIDDIYPTRQVKHAAVSWRFKRAPAAFSEPFRAEVTGYLARNPVTGLLIAKDDQILFEHYQYGRTDRDRFVSQSMVKSITGLLIGIAISEGAIKSVDDTPESYVPAFLGSDYARLARLLAHDGAWGGRQIIPAQWMVDATTVRPSDGYLAPGKADRDFGYGWLLPWGQRQFAMFGDFGQRVCVDPASQIVMVQT